jgi:murein DD-endopeptidase MepM/ murein hydrolase activator NlpD
VDLRAADGDQVRAAADGVVILARSRMALTGGSVLVDHGYGLVSAYFHLSKVLVHAGQALTPGQALGLSGHSGLSNGPHLHFELRLRGISVAPDPWMQGPAAVPGAYPDK